METRFYQTAHAAINGQRNEQSDVIEGRLPFHGLPPGGGGGLASAATPPAQATAANATILDDLDPTIQMLELLQQLGAGLVLRIIFLDGHLFHRHS